MAGQQAIAKIDGLLALRKDIDRMTKDAKGPLFSALKAAGYSAVQPIVPAARDALPVSDRNPSASHRPGLLAKTLRPSAYRSGAAVRMGSKQVPWAGWVEFGGTRRKPFQSEREYVKDGRYLFPAARGLATSAASKYTQALTAVFGSGRVWTNTTDNASAVHD